MRVATTTEAGPVATLTQDQINTEFSHIIRTNFSGQLTDNAAEIGKWLQGSSTRLAIRDTMDSWDGRIYQASTQTFIKPTGVNTVLVRTSTGFNVFTSYPIP